VRWSAYDNKELTWSPCPGKRGNVGGTPTKESRGFSFSTTKKNEQELQGGRWKPDTFQKPKKRKPAGQMTGSDGVESAAAIETDRSDLGDKHAERLQGILLEPLGGKGNRASKKLWSAFVRFLSGGARFSPQHKHQWNKRYKKRYQKSMSTEFNRG